MEDEYVGNHKFFQCLDMIKSSVVEGKFTDDKKQEMYETFQCYIKGEHRLDPETVKCLFTGYFIRQIMNNQ